MSAPLVSPLSRLVSQQQNALEIYYDRQRHERAPWLECPPDGKYFERTGTFTPIAYATEVELASFVVPKGHACVLNALVCGFDGSNFQEGSGDILWSVDINSPAGSTALLSGYPLPDLGEIKFSRGSFQFEAWKLPGFGYAVVETCTIRLKATPVQNVGLNAPNLLFGGIFGWYWPRPR